MTNEQQKNLDIVKEYFQKVDAGDPSLVNLFSNEVQIFFPKFGIGKGLSAIQEFAAVWGGRAKKFVHHFEEFNYVVAGDTVVAEGSESGELNDGSTWEHIRFCTVFTLKNGLITRMHLYADPDITEQDHDRLLWGKPKSTRWDAGGKITS